MVDVGDEIELATKKIGQAPRIGTVVAIVGSLVTVRWPTGDQTKLVAAPGTLSVIRAAGSKTAKPTSAAAKKKSARTKESGTSKKQKRSS